jgi:ABC-2 type transport system permease protein
MVAIFKRELRAYFASPTGYIFMGFFLLISGVLVALNNFMSASPNYQGMLGSITFVFFIVVPVLTMRLFSEEMRQRTDVLLLTHPVSVTGVVLGKYLAALTLFLITLAVTVLYPVLMSFFGSLEVGEIVTGYVGFFLLGACFIAVGLFISSLTDNQVVAAVVTFGALLLIWILDAILQGLPKDVVAGVIFAALLVIGAAALVYFTTRSLFVTLGVVVAGAAAVLLLYFLKKEVYDGFVVRFFEWLSLLKRYESFNLGIIKLSPIAYYLSFAGTFVFLTVRMIEKKRWA